MGNLESCLGNERPEEKNNKDNGNPKPKHKYEVLASVREILPHGNYGRDYVIPLDSYIIGTDGSRVNLVLPDNESLLDFEDIRMNASCVNPVHCKIEKIIDSVDGDVKYQLSDFGSKYGTRVSRGSDRIDISGSPFVLESGDIIEIGHSKYNFKLQFFLSKQKKEEGVDNIRDDIDLKAKGIYDDIYKICCNVDGDIDADIRSVADIFNGLNQNSPLSFCLVDRLGIDRFENDGFKVAARARKVLSDAVHLHMEEYSRNRFSQRLTDPDSSTLSFVKYDPKTCMPIPKDLSNGTDNSDSTKGLFGRVLNGVKTAVETAVEYVGEIIRGEK